MEQEAVLIVDDDPDISGILQEMVELLGYRTAVAKNGTEALGLVREQPFHIIISDVHMPEMSGLDLIKSVRSIAADVPFIIMTGYDQYTYDMVTGAGANDFIKKPFTFRELETKLHRIFKERALSLENRRLLEQQRAVSTRLSNLLEAAMLLTAELDFERLLTLINGHITKAIHAERSSLYLIDWEQNEIWTTVAEQVSPIRLPVGKGISGRVAETGETINVEDVATLPFFDPAFDAKHHFHTRSVLCIPIYNRDGERAAVIQVMNKIGEPRFCRDDEDLLKSLGAQIAIALENSRLMEELKLSFESAVRTLSATVDARHRLTAGHSQRVTEYALLIGREMGLGSGEQEIIKYAGLLHDIGKIGVRDDVLMKCGRFSPEEREEMNMHTVKTQAILEKFRFPKALGSVPFIAAHHHEKVNGEGYPDGLQGDAIPLASRILAVTDVFDALTSPRDYPKYTKTETLSTDAMPLAKAISILRHDAGTHFDPAVVEVFLACLPHALVNYRGTHFDPDYVDGTIRELAPELLQ